MNISTFSIIMVGILTILVHKLNLLEKMLIIILDYYSMQEVHQLKNKHHKKTNNNLNKLKIIMMIIVKFQSTLIKMEQLNGCVLNSLLLNKIHKWLVLDL